MAPTIKQNVIGDNSKQDVIELVSKSQGFGLRNLALGLTALNRD